MALRISSSSAGLAEKLRLHRYQSAVQLAVQRENGGNIRLRRRAYHSLCGHLVLPFSYMRVNQKPADAVVRRCKSLDFLDRVLEAVLLLQLLDGRLAVLNEGRRVDALAVVGLLVLLDDLVQLVPASSALAWSISCGKSMINSRCLGMRAFIVSHS